MKKYFIFLLAISLSGCQHPDQNTYDAKDIGKASMDVFGTVVSARSIDIKEETNGTGATTGAFAGAVGGSAIGGGRGALLAVIAGAVIGGVTGHMVEQGIINHNGMEYTIKTINPGKKFKRIISIAQNIGNEDKPIAVGSCVMVQVGGNYQRVLPMDDPSLCKESHLHKFKKKSTDEEKVNFLSKNTI